MKLAAAALLLVACGAQAQDVARFKFATLAQARAVLGASDDYVRATAPLERSAKLRSAEAIGAERFVAAMEADALGWTRDEQAALAGVLVRLEGFLSPMRWQVQPTILLVKASDRLMDGFPHTRGNAIVLQETMIREALAQPRTLDYLMSHETFHVLSRANPRLREALYGAIGFRRCSAVDIPQQLASLRLTNPDAPEIRHAITLRRAGRTIEVLPFVHFASEAIDPRAGFAAQIRTSWLPVDRSDGGCKVGNERQAIEELQGLYEQVGRNTGYLIHPEEILADNFALLFMGSGNVASPEVLERIRQILH